MVEVELPSRAKPEALHTLARFIRDTSINRKSELYDEMELDRRQIRAAMDYGAKLGILRLEEEGNDEVVHLTEKGTVISFNDNVTESGVQRVFRDAIEDYEPYRNTFLRVYSEEATETVKGVRCVVQSTLEQFAEELTEQDLTRREINLVIKTAEAAGLGKFVTGRKGLETRLAVSEDFDRFLDNLAENHELPVYESSSDTSVETGSTISGQGILTRGSNEGGGEPNGRVAINIEIDPDGSVRVSMDLPDDAELDLPENLELGLEDADNESTATGT